MQKAFTFKDKDGILRAGHLEATDEMYRRIIINEENINQIEIDFDNI